MSSHNTTAADAGWNLDNSYARLPEVFYQRLAPVPVRSPRLVILNRPLAEKLGLNPNLLEQEDGAAMLAGNLLPADAFPLAQAYAGHQYGYFTMLGDGRAILLGEQITPAGERFDIQLKGSGQTPFSRSGDGRAALGPMLREYLISEAMHFLGIPTTRSLAVVATGEPVFRETPLQGAILTRVAASHLRVGTFEYAAALGMVKHLQVLADYSIARHFPDAAGAGNPCLALFEGVIERQALLIAKWLQVGFIHGVMNTDNMALSGETIDFGPCAFIDTYNPETVFSSIDAHGRYAFARQPQIAQWNLARFAEALLPLLADDQKQAIELAQEVLGGFQQCFERHYYRLMRSKLGFFTEETGDRQLIDELLQLMHRHQADYTNSFRALALAELPGEALFTDTDFTRWRLDWKLRQQRENRPDSETIALMNRHNPAVIPRNHRVEEALAAAANEQNLQPLKNLLRILANPYADPGEADSAYREPPNPSSRGYQTFCGT